MTRALGAQTGEAEGVSYRAGQGLPPRAGPVTAARLETSQAGVRPVTAPVSARRAGLTWPRLPAAAELAIIGAGYAAYSLVRLAIRASRPAAFAHAAQLWQAERRLHLTAEPYLNHLAAAHSVFADAAGYYYGLLHFLITPLVLAWLYLRRPAEFARLRSGLVLATAAANVVFWVWPTAPPRFSVPGMTDILVTRDILGAAHPHGATSLVNLYAAMPSLHVAWAAWCALAVITATRGWWRHLAWFYPAATTLVVLASANHFLLDAVGGIAVAGLGMLAAIRPRVTFSRGRRGMVLPTMVGGLWMAVDGLSGAATIWLYTTAWRQVGSPARRLTTVKRRREP